MDPTSHEHPQGLTKGKNKTKNWNIRFKVPRSFYILLKTFFKALFPALLFSRVLPDYPESSKQRLLASMLILEAAR
jgi:hypothetical protein